MANREYLSSSNKERNKEHNDYYSNCLFEAIKAKIKWGKQVKSFIFHR